ncbi:hypothetical protein WA026_006823 [Henosepilachna vigintioctopunctata]|uniref:Uncharacterized protein n=1 Tax=Henosepilachna vigintioctopunctata TaxID=420089 RepID=A0AAW1U810_9CUCU
MQRLLSVLVALAFFVIAVASFGGSGDKFIKKYAMLKIYESCFGQEVVKQIRKEMKAACAKCASFDEPPPSPPSVESPSPSVIPLRDHTTENGNALFPIHGFDQGKINQAILAYRPNPFPTPQYKPFSPVSGYYPFNNPMFQSPIMYPTFQQPSQFSPYAYSIVGQPFLGGNRMGRNIDVRNSFEDLSSKMSGKVKNVTCVMQQLGYLDENLEPNYAKISERISNLPVSEELKKDIQDGVEFCQQFSQCVPEIKKESFLLSRELIRPMFFFKCYKHKKLEACVMKDVREKYVGVSDDELDEDVEIRRQGKSAQDGNEAEIDALATNVYEFLYASDPSLDIENIL